MPPGLIEEENGVSARSDFGLRSHRDEAAWLGTVIRYTAEA